MCHDRLAVVFDLAELDSEDVLVYLDVIFLSLTTSLSGRKAGSLIWPAVPRYVYLSRFLMKAEVDFSRCEYDIVHLIAGRHSSLYWTWTFGRRSATPSRTEPVHKLACIK